MRLFSFNADMQNERGASMVEAAIVIPVLILVVLGIIQMGFMLSAQITLRNASAAGARWGIVNIGDANFNSGVTNAVLGSIAPLNPASVVVPAPVVSGGTNPTVRVTVNYSLPLFPGSLIVLGRTGNFAMTSQTVMQ